MASAPTFWAVIPAAGSGSRMGAPIPKQYLPIGERTVLEHTILKLLEVERLSGVLVVLSNDDTQFTHLSIASHPKVSTTIGGAERSESVLNALSYLEQKIDVQDWVLVHDAARPCVSKDSIEQLIQTISAHPVGGLLAVPVSDTLKKVDNTQLIEQTVDRQVLWQAQTPQMFRYGMLRESLQQALALSKAVTDESSAMEMSGHSPIVVKGQRDNIKITHSEDLALAEFILQQQRSK